MGFATTCLPILALTMGLEVALPLVLVPSVANNIIVQIEVGHFRDSMSRFWPLIVAGMAGVVIGLVLLTWMEARLAAAVLGVVLIVHGLFALKTPNLTMPPRLEKPLASITGLATGIVNGLTGSQLMPVLPYMLSLHLDRDRFVQAINCSFSSSSIVMAIGLSKTCLMNAETALVSAIGVIPVWVGLKLGGKIRRRLAPEMFRLLVIYMLMASGVLLLIRAA
jgi:uncharacterized membrane protein YfcA